SRSSRTFSAPTALSRSLRRCNPIWAVRRRSERMAEPINRDKCRILIANDDGIRSPAIQDVEKIARELSDDVWVVAPEHEQSLARATGGGRRGPGRRARLMGPR